MTMIAGCQAAYVLLRQKAAAQIGNWDDKTGKWECNDSHGYNQLIKLLGYKQGTLLINFTPEDANTCELLLGPHGYAIYKMLLIRFEENKLNDSTP
jgi:hypothetical protein